MITMKIPIPIVNHADDGDDVGDLVDGEGEVDAFGSVENGDDCDAGDVDDVDGDDDSDDDEGDDDDDDD